MKLSNVSIWRLARLVFAALLLTVGTALAITPTRATAALTAPAAGSQPGSAIATTSVLGVAPVVSGASLTVTLGTSQAQYQGSTVEASSAVIDPGGLGQILTTSKICGRSLPLSALPPGVQADTTAKPSARAHTTIGPGTEDVAVTSNPIRGTATTKPVALALPGVADITGSTSTTVSFAGGTGSATATATDRIELLGGIVTITGAQWTASQQYDTARHSQAGFSFGAISIKALPGLPLKPLTIAATNGAAAALKVVNKALALIGVTLSLPTKQVATRSRAVSITPLEVYLSGSSLDRALAMPVFRAFHQLEQALTGHLASTTSCAQLAGIVHGIQGPFDSVFAVISGGIEGSGGFALDVGGATASAGPPSDFTNPFGGTPPPGIGSSTGVAAPSSTPPNDLGAKPLRNPAAAGSPRGSAFAGPPPVVAGNTSFVCRSLNQTTGGSCSSGYATPVALTAIALGGALWVADIVQGRRRSRRTTRRARA